MKLPPQQIPLVRLKGVRCPACRMLQSGCICDELPQIHTETDVVLVIQWLDYVRPSNTGHLAFKVLTSPHLLIRGLPNQPLPTTVERPTHSRLLMLYTPGPDTPAPPTLDASFGPKQSGRPTILLVPDGTWSQTRRMVRREKLFHDAEMVCLPPGPASTYHVRTRRADHELSTYEALCRALSLLEDDPTLEARMMPAFERLVHGMMLSRGQQHRLP